MPRTGHDSPPRHRPGPSSPPERTGRCAGFPEENGAPVRAVAGLGDAAWFVETVIEGPGRRRVVLRGDIGPVGADRLRAHLAEICETAVHHILVDATDVARCDPLVVELLADTQHRLAGRRGLLTMIGLDTGSRHR